LLEGILFSFERSRGTYGSPRILRDLREQGYCCGRQRVARLMRQAGLKPTVRSRFRVTTDSKHALPVADNLLAREFTASAVDVKWASDITYLWTGEGWLYLAVTLDLFSRRVVGWSMQSRLDRSLVVNALESALCQRRPEAGLLHHSDRGSQYASGEFQAMLCRQGIACSMSRKGDCWDNAAVESFFGTLKQELVNRCQFATREIARKEVFEYIEVWYNRQRRHSTLGYMSPAQFERQALLSSSISSVPA
jgi:putative transposase